MKTVYYNSHSNTRKTEELLESIGVERFSMYDFEVVAETPKGAILHCLDNLQLAGFLYCTLPIKSVVIASIYKVTINSNGNLFICLRLESVKSYGQEREKFTQTAA